MVLFTKEIFIQLKTLIQLNVTVQVNDYPDGQGKINRQEIWQVYIHGVIANVPPHAEIFQTQIGAPSKEEAYRLYQELAQQVVDSGEIHALNTKLIDAVLSNKEK